MTSPLASADCIKERPITKIQETLCISTTIQHMSSTYFINFLFNKLRIPSDNLVRESNWGCPFLFCGRRKRRWSICSSSAGKGHSQGSNVVEGNPSKSGGPELWSLLISRHDTSHLASCVSAFTVTGCLLSICCSHRCHDFCYTSEILHSIYLFS